MDREALSSIALSSMSVDELRRLLRTIIARLNPLVARAVAGHAQGDVLLDHYFADDVIVATLETLPQPF
jgi:hypothetical protein